MPNFNRTKNTDVDIILNWNNNISVPLASRIFLTNEILSLRAVRTACSSCHGSVSSVLILILSKSSRNQNSIPTQTKTCLEHKFYTNFPVETKMKPSSQTSKRQRLHQNQQPPKPTTKEPQPQMKQQQLQQLLSSESEYEDYSSDDSLDECLDKACLYPERLTADDIAKMGYQSFIQLTHLCLHGQCNCRDY